LIVFIIEDGSSAQEEMAGEVLWPAYWNPNGVGDSKPEPDRLLIEHGVDICLPIWP
jgi:hypothetical protein